MSKSIRCDHCGKTLDRVGYTIAIDPIGYDFDFNSFPADDIDLCSTCAHKFFDMPNGLIWKKEECENNGQCHL